MTFSDINLKFTLTNVCFGQETFADNEIMIYDLTNLGEPRPKVERYVLWTRWKRAQWCVLSVIKLKNKIVFRRKCLIDIQRHVRMHLVYKRYTPRQEL
ncbi:unnamed protein product [Rotaria magnacalcarata]|uniref:Myosin VI lever arm domain-containing protein n=1 Tax=Rotaria magnacalcarata TaxID=392030 RepID=A0A819JDP8_9BILA|nr:unnamed protein product [Rotaria magnacalcarata]CAF3931156.1 unnamed protein product [Rotaria magnacalcarata]